MGLGIVLSSCDMLPRAHQAGVVAEVGGQVLYESDLKPMVAGLDSVDSVRVAELYIRQWATEILVYERARDKADREIERLVEDYRRSLYVHAYEQKLLGQMSKRVPQADVEAFYESHKDTYVLRESIVRGVLLVVPVDAPKLKELKQQLMTLTKKDEEVYQEQMEKIEKYAYQYASGYELFVDEWKTANQLLLSMPFEKNNLVEHLKHEQQIILEDSVSAYILQVTDKRLQGELMPMDYAKPEIEKVLLRDRQVQYLEAERAKLYDRYISKQ